MSKECLNSYFYRDCFMEKPSVYVHWTCLKCDSRKEGNDTIILNCVGLLEEFEVLVV